MLALANNPIGKYMELRHLRHFIAVAEELHFARAAERLGMEQSPLSQSIRNLEADLNVKLFHRTTRRTWLTRAGTRFYAEAKRILGDIDAAAASLAIDHDEGPVHIRLALGDDLAGEPFRRLLFELEHHRLGARIDVRELFHAEAARLVRSGGADIAATFDSRQEYGLQRRRGWAEPLMLIVPLGHRLAEKDQVSLQEIAVEEVALPRPDSCPGYLGQIESIFFRQQIVPAGRVAIRHWNTAVSLASTGRAVALCPASFVASATSVAVVPLEESDAELITWLLYPEAELSLAVSLVLETAALVDMERESFLGLNTSE